MDTGDDELRNSEVKTREPIEVRFWRPVGVVRRGMYKESYVRTWETL